MNFEALGIILDEFETYVEQDCQVHIRWKESRVKETKLSDVLNVLNVLLMKIEGLEHKLAAL